MVTLGDEVRDTVSGFKGVATCRHKYLQGCDRISVQPPVDKQGCLPEMQSFDEPQLEVIKAKAVKAEPEVKQKRTKVGGPERFADKQRVVERR